ncbi:hypothetical protein YC2023_087039 [Brassica napus]
MLARFPIPIVLFSIPHHVCGMVYWKFIYNGVMVWTQIKHNVLGGWVIEQKIETENKKNKVKTIRTAENTSKYLCEENQKLQSTQNQQSTQRQQIYRFTALKKGGEQLLIYGEKGRGLCGKRLILGISRIPNTCEEHNDRGGTTAAGQSNTAAEGLDMVNDPHIPDLLDMEGPPQRTAHQISGSVLR